MMTMMATMSDCFRQEATVPLKGLTPESMSRLSEYDWPGNVRQLRNVIHRACVLSTEELVHIEDSSLENERFRDDVELPRVLNILPLREIERKVILHRIETHGGNKTAAARALGVTPRTLRNKLTEYRRLGHVG